MGRLCPHFCIIMVLKKTLVLKIINDHSSQQIYKQDQDQCICCQLLVLIRPSSTAAESCLSKRLGLANTDPRLSLSVQCSLGQTFVLKQADQQFSNNNNNNLHIFVFILLFTLATNSVLNQITEGVLLHFYILYHVIYCESLC